YNYSSVDRVKWLDDNIQKDVLMFQQHQDESLYDAWTRFKSGNLRVLSAEEAWETNEDCVQCDKQWKNPTRTISDQTIANLKAQLVRNEVVRVKIPKCMSWLDAYDEPIGDLDMMEDKVNNPSPQRIPMEVEPLEHMKLEDLGLNTCSRDLFLSYREISSVNEPEPQL
ncbi:hypothetical protein Tco_1431281, partial [Tanacetum coccineum]